MSVVAVRLTMCLGVCRCGCAELEDALEELFTAIGTVTDPEGRLLSTWFQLVPHRTVRHC